MRTPTHPGIILKEILEELDCSIENAAREMSVDVTALEQFTQGKTDCTPEFARILGEFTETSSESWQNMQDRLTEYKNRKQFPNS